MKSPAIDLGVRMQCDFEISQGIYLVQSLHKLDLHNDFIFLGFDYSLEYRKLVLRWRRSPGEWVCIGTPASVSIEFQVVSEFRFQPRDSAKPFTEDDCVNSIGYWTDEDWADGVFEVESNQQSDPNWLTAIEFVSGAVIAVQAASAQAQIEP